LKGRGHGVKVSRDRGRQRTTLPTWIPVIPRSLDPVIPVFLGG